jgi:lipopolysaccharide export system protein LptA
VLRWQRRARLGLAAFGIACAIAVYAAIGERRQAPPLERPVREDPRSVIESTGAAFEQFRADKQEYVIEAERQLTYEGGATKFVGVRIHVNDREGRDFVMAGREAQVGDKRQDIEVSGDVQLSASDGFVATTDRATFSEADATVRAAGAVQFRKGRMSGSGVGMTYNQQTDILTLADQVQVAVTDDTGRVTTEFTALAATFARIDHYLSLGGAVHARRDGQILEAENGRALLSDQDDVITFIELRGGARVAGGPAVESMRAGAIDLDYSDDGVSLERVVLIGDSAVGMPPDGEAPGRQFSADRLDLSLAEDATVTAVQGRGNVRMVLPAANEAPQRAVQAAALDAVGEPGRGLTAARFDDAVEYREAGGDGASRVARAQSLRTTLSGGAVTEAVFTTRVTFEAEGLQASAGEATYDPAAGVLRLRGAEAGRSPRVVDESIEIEAAAIHVTLAGPVIGADGIVRTLLRPSDGARGVSASNRLPGLLQQGQAARVTAESLDYRGDAGTAVYTGTAMLWQGDTAVRANRLTLDQRRAGLTAAGNARLSLPLEGGTSVGRGGEIRYEDAQRLITIEGAPAGERMPSSGAGRGPAAPAAVAALAQLGGPQGDLQAERIEVFLARETSHLDRLEAHRQVNARVDTRVATADRLSYVEANGRYVLVGLPRAPVRVVETCRETTGRTVTFFRSTDRIIVDGNEEIRTQSTRGAGASCSESPAR